MANLAPVEIKAFVPAKDFELSRRFYRDLGFVEELLSDQLAFFYTGRASFLLQRFYNQQHAENFMMHLLVEDVDAWWEHVEAQHLARKYLVRAAPPEDRPWGIRDFILVDPSSVLWRIGQSIQERSES
ncbi:glyoxalase [Rhizobium sp. LjRoot30]|uniref:VOC family protein n=1 Tax=Rhizobium sp. LjRoot30 TaxID=3342320 RepID=UPI003ECCAFA8